MFLIVINLHAKENPKTICVGACCVRTCVSTYESDCGMEAFIDIVNTMCSGLPGLDGLSGGKGSRGFDAPSAVKGGSGESGTAGFPGELYLSAFIYYI